MSTLTGPSQLGTWEIGDSGVVTDNTDRISFSVEEGASDGITFVLRKTPNLTWWKSLDVFTATQGSFWPQHLARIEVKDDRSESQQFLHESQISNLGYVQFWKGGFMGFGAQVTTITMNMWSNRGRRFVFTWERD